MNIAELNIPEELLSKIQSIGEEKIIEPTVPIDVYLQEAENTVSWAQTDLKDLAIVGIQEQDLVDLKERIDICRLVQTQWMTLKRIKTKEQIEWERTKKEAISLRNKLIFQFRFAFRDNEGKLKTLARMKRSTHRTELPIDLGTLYHMGKNSTERLKSIAFDFELLDKALSYSTLFRNASTRWVTSTPEKVHVKKLRDQSYTYLKLLLDKVRSGGKYVFSKNKERRQGYTVQYFKRRRITPKESKL